MTLILIVVHVAVCIALIMIVLFQTGKGADLGAAFGGGASQTLFGSAGASTFLSKATTVAAVVFMLTSLTLAYLAGGQREASSIMKKAAESAAQQAADTAAPAGEATNPPGETANAPAPDSSAPAATADAPGQSAPAPVGEASAPSPGAADTPQPTEQAAK